MPASINQMLSGGIVISTCLLSKIVLKKPIHNHHALGCSLAILGFMFVGLAGLINESSISRYGTTSLVIGVIMVFVSLFAQGIQFIVEEHIFTNYMIDPYLVVGTEGFFGTIYIMVVIFIMSFIPCPSNLMCDITGVFEDPVSGFIQ